MIPITRPLLPIAIAFFSFGIGMGAEESEKNFKPLFDGKTLDGWKVGGNPDAFKIVDEAIVAKGDCAHLFYDGKVNNAKFANFELRMDVKTLEKSNGGVFIVTEYQGKGWPAKGYEIQVNNTGGDWKKSGGVYNFQDNKEPFGDNEWMKYVIRVDDGKVIVHINGKPVSDYKPEKNESRLTSEGGTIALQAHDSGSTVYYKNIRIKDLP